MKIQVTLWVEPTGKSRPRVMSKGGKTWAYTPKNTVKTEAFIRESLMHLDKSFGVGVPLKLTAIFYRQKPKSASKKMVFPVTRPDLDQYIKLLLDACQKYIFPDDAAIVSIEAYKRFGSPPRIKLIIEEDKNG